MLSLPLPFFAGSHVLLILPLTFLLAFPVRALAKTGEITPYELDKAAYVTRVMDVFNRGDVEEKIENMFVLLTVTEAQKAVEQGTRPPMTQDQLLTLANEVTDWVVARRPDR